MTTLEKDSVVEVEYAGKDGKGVLAENRTGGDVNLIDQYGQVRRIPIPSADPNDPLNFSKWRKLGIMVCCCWFSVFSLVLVAGLGPIIPVFMDLYMPQGYSSTEIINLTTYPSLVMACGAFLMLPLSMMFGRRPVFLVCSTLLLGTTIGAGYSQTFETHMAMRILQGFATGATESVLPLIITDISFLDERGLLFGAYWGTQNLINAVFIISGSYLVAASSWRWFYFTFAIINAFGLLLSIFLLPETRYDRSPTSYNGQVVHTDEFGVTTILSDEEAEARYGTRNQTTSATTIPLKTSYISQLSPYSSPAPNALRLGIGAILKMLQSLTSPAVLWAILASSISLGSGIAISLTYASVLIESFHWSPSSTGLVNAGIFPASLLAMFYAGFIGDRINLFLARRRNGKHIPEDTLVILIFPSIVSAIGIAVYAFTAQSPERVGSAWGVIMGWTLQQFGFIVLLVSSTHFAAEAFPANPGSALVMVVGMKNVVSFGASYGIVPMVHKFDYLTAYMILFGLFFGIFLLGIPVYFFNPKWRAYISRRQ
ncbi:hypothetical protein CKM354_000025900 [Cercospora kikuchii]|uniref:Major facilitator superfamily (MFS) profile domain-containing protein n=1 Tax=Cercospora kikuchii TaxID=84275 RepID=A0A9P3C4Z9_9PEZI|nr:uncharacterized protein CKM354_000025900 [Cercospora kikuchii]GIZ36792.1 hypothetical protein CKM354_000025900 [Cercospora kikuchii]